MAWNEGVVRRDWTVLSRCADFERSMLALTNEMRLLVNRAVIPTVHTQQHSTVSLAYIPLSERRSGESILRTVARRNERKAARLRMLGRHERHHATALLL